MKTLMVKLDIGKPLSMNNKLVPVRGRLIKAKSFRVYEDKVDDELGKYYDQFLVLGQGWNEKRHALEVNWYIYAPKDEFFTKKGTISKTCLDATNTVKILEDRLSVILGVDDSQICSSSVKKIPTDSSSWCVVLEISIVARPEVIHLSNEKLIPAALTH